MNIVQQPTFHWRVLEEDIFITGQKGSGKTTRCKRILDLIKPQFAFWIWSPQRPIENYGSYGHIVRDVNQLKHGQYIYAGTDWSDEVFIRFLKKAFTQMRNIVLILDDIHERTTKQSVLKELNNLVLSGRNRGICSVFITTRPGSVPNYILANVSHVFAYKFVLETDAEWLQKNLIGPDAWILLPKDKRTKFLTGPEDIDILPPHSYVYRNESETESQVVIDNR